MNKSPIINKDTLEKLYKKYNRREFVSPDPLEFLYDYKNIRDREIAGLIASSLAYGRVGQILKSVSTILNQMNPSPSAYLRNKNNNDIKKTFKDFKHRFTTGDDVSDLLIGIKFIIKKYGSLEKCFFSGLKREHETVLDALSTFAKEFPLTPTLSPKGRGEKMRCIIPSPANGSACKRLHLFLRWMVRNDEVDPGGWSKIPKSKLIIPLDTHMHKIGLMLGFTKRKQADAKTAMEITRAFAHYAHNDPVKYDFALTRFGIRDELCLSSLKKLTA